MRHAGGPHRQRPSRKDRTNKPKTSPVDAVWSATAIVFVLTFSIGALLLGDASRYLAGEVGLIGPVLVAAVLAVAADRRV